MHITLCVSKNKCLPLPSCVTRKNSVIPTAIIKSSEYAVQRHACRIVGKPRENRRSVVQPISSPELDQFNRLDLVAFDRAHKRISRNKKGGPLSRFSLVVGPVRVQYGLYTRLPYQKRPFRRHCSDDTSGKMWGKLGFLARTTYARTYINASLERFQVKRFSKDI